ncbi:MAG: choice-of-anchor tandem repeat GloVer-containing protein [Verrucomicrobiota bacterium]
MKTSIRNLLLLPALIAGLGLMPAGRVGAQTFTTLHSFTVISGSPSFDNSDGADPNAGLILSGNTLYGTAVNGGAFFGTLFAVNTNGSGFTNLYSFTNGSDGAFPQAGLILSGNTLYGTAAGGGTSGCGTVFAVNTNGSGFTVLYSFTNGSDGAHPEAGLILSGNTLYGTAARGGVSGDGTVFAVNAHGSGFTNLYDFSALDTATSTTNSDGANPQASLILSGNTLYGTAAGGGTSGYGTVFAVNTDGTGFTNLHNFSALDAATSTTNSDGADPQAGLALSGNTLYGTAQEGGTSGYGTIFKVNTDGTGFTNLYSFTNGSDGANPYGGLILSGNTLYGTASDFDSSVNGSGSGTVFQVKSDGTGFTTLYSFTALSKGTNNDGDNPVAGLISSGNTLYGTAYQGGGLGNGTVFSLSLVSPLLSVIISGTNVIFTWTNTPPGFTLQCTTNLSPAAWCPVCPAPLVLSGRNTVTNAIVGTQQFFRLSQ